MKSKQAFTLIELLVTIAIISILSSIVIASLSSAKEDANNTTLIRQASQLQRNILYCSEGLESEKCNELSFGDCNASIITNKGWLTTVLPNVIGEYAVDCAFRPGTGTGLCDSDSLVNYATASSFCSDNGGRLCTINEIGVTRSGGCNFDNTQNWTTTTCVDDGSIGVLTARGGGSWDDPAFHMCETNLLLDIGTISCCSDNQI